MIDLDEYVRADATTLVDFVRRGLTNPAELLELAKQRHHETDERIHAVVEWYGDPDEPTITSDAALPGVPFLRKALDLTFFPELYAVRAEIGD